jgi:hypothetical protein
MAQLTAEYPIETRPRCLTCRNPMVVGGTPKRRRWGCGGCDYSILFVGRGYGSSRERKRALRLEFDSRPHDAELKLVTKQVKKGLVTVEEISEKVSLPSDEINLLCELLVTQSKAEPDGYEWRPIGPKNKHGARLRGIFPKNAPALITSVLPKVVSPYQQTAIRRDEVEALDEFTAKVRQHEANGRKGKQLPWETADEYAKRLRGIRTNQPTVRARASDG